ncbi:mannose-6-phosphate isomerase [Enhydrobacter aerosaccus]|uniref:Mannose-6-phosphate isomerase n=1 Tax=Enhydrobacter aerosaccus TaxID=225324 RepID=A0A1T4KIG5_9HYPH|nr:AGE family epimerase/isomerase [Enhydrobacter aerosaccus]SJZ42176.1 mannose-6-phosphate isomerase [Enhydrobacter aerosaccus]
MQGLEESSAVLRAWAVDQALPLWATAGFDPKTGRFREALDLDGVPLLDVPTRLIVQSRQIFSYALAAERKWFSGAVEIVERAYEALVRDYYRPDGKAGWVYSVHADGRIGDARRDLYSHAFALLAISSYIRATGRREALALADETLAFIDRDMHAPNSGGYIEALPQAEGPRRQNPHMHLFEAFLSLWSVTREGRFLARAGEMFALFSSRFFRASSGTLGEYFDNALHPAAGAAGDIVEPGHHSEWVWLLRWFEHETGRFVQPYIDRLYAHAARHGYDSAGLMVDEVLIDGTHRLPSHRTWPMTEAIKANVAEARAGRVAAADKAGELATLLFERFFKPAHPGGWMDRLDANGGPAASTMPSSTLYHVLCAVDELDRFVVAPST